MQRPTIMVDFITLKGVLMLPTACIVMLDNDSNPSSLPAEIPLFLRNSINFFPSLLNLDSLIYIIELFKASYK